MYRFSYKKGKHFGMYTRARQILIYLFLLDEEEKPTLTKFRVTNRFTLWMLLLDQGAEVEISIRGKSSGRCNTLYAGTCQL